MLMPPRPTGVGFSQVETLCLKLDTPSGCFQRRSLVTKELLNLLTSSVEGLAHLTPLVASASASKMFCLTATGESTHELAKISFGHRKDW